VKGENAIGDELQAPVGQHGACGLPMVMIGRRNVKKAWHPDQIASMNGRDMEYDPEGYDALMEEWQCPCGCTKRYREL